MDRHLRRLQDSLDGARLPNPYSSAQWKAIIQRIIAEAPFEDQARHFQITRGADVKRDPPSRPACRKLSSCLPRRWSTRRQRSASTVSARSTPDIRWGRCDLKTVALLPNVLARQLSVTLVVSRRS